MKNIYRASRTRRPTKYHRIIATLIAALIIGTVALWLSLEPYSNTARYAAMTVLGLECFGVATWALYKMARV